MATAQNIIDTAKSQVGKIKYVFGGNNPSGGSTDCSGFTQYVFKLNGINIGRTTQSQWTDGTNVEKSDLLPGDLVFFKNTYDSNYIDGVSHVGIYIGNNKFYHNSSSQNGIVIGDLSDNYWTAHYLGARSYGLEDQNHVIVTGGLAEDSGNGSNSIAGGAIMNWLSGILEDVITSILAVLVLLLGVFMITKMIKTL